MSTTTTERTSQTCHLLGVVLLLLALVVGGAVRLELARTAPPFLVANDSADYFSAGYHLITSGEFPLAVKRTPLYALALGGLTAVVGPSLDRLMLAQHVLGLLTIVLTYLLGQLAFATLRFGALAAGAAALAVAVNGSLLTMEHLLISEVLFTPLLLASLAAVLAAIRWCRPGLWLLAGLLLGLDTLCRPLGIAVLGVVLLALPFGRLPRRVVLQGAALMLLGATVCVAPWLIRQRLAHEDAAVNGVNGGLGDALFSRVHRYDPTFTLDAGQGGTEQERAIRARILDLASQYDYPREIRAAVRAELGIDDAEADRQLRAVALSTISHDPVRYLLGTLSMTGRLARSSDPGLVDLWSSIRRDRVIQGWPSDLLWMLATDRPIDDEAAFSHVQAILTLFRDDLPNSVVPLALAPLGAAWALLAHRRTGAGIVPLVILTQIVLYVALDGLLFRYRLPLQPSITLLGGAGLALVLDQVALAWSQLRRQMASERLAAQPVPVEPS